MKHNSGRLTEEVNAEEDSFHDMLIFMDLLTNLLNKEIIDLGVSEGSSSVQFTTLSTVSNCVLSLSTFIFLENGTKGQPIVNSIDVCMLGLRGILPLMSVETLKFPTLCSRFYTVSLFRILLTRFTFLSFFTPVISKCIPIFFQLLTFICELHAEKVYEQPHEFLVNILAVIELGLTLFGAEITTLCCEFIQTFSKYLCLNVAQLQPEKFLLLQPFLKVGSRSTLYLSRLMFS